MVNKQIIQELINHLKLGKPILNKRRTPIDIKTEKKYIVWLNKIDRWLDKPFNKLTGADIDTFRQDLKNDVIRRDNGKVYSEGTKRDIEQKFLRVLLNYLGKLELAQYTVSYSSNVEIPAISKENIEIMITQSKLRDKVILQVLFDGGFRAEEFLNIQFKDIKDDALKSQGFYKIRITKSKTKTRTVGLTLPQSKEIIKAWLNKNKDKIGTSKPFVDLSYRHLNLIIRRLGENIINQKITPHQLRHSSATYYCHHLSQYQLCKRYGWTMSSDMPQKYIDREGVEDEKINGLIVAEENISLQKEINNLQEQLNLKNQEIEANQEEISKRMKAMEKQQLQLLRMMAEKVKVRKEKT